MSGILASTERKREGPGWRAAVVGGIALLAWLLAVVAGGLGVGSRAADFFYDAYYHARPQQDMQDAEVVLVAADQASLTQVDQRFKRGWPWPREFWGHIAAYLDRAGAKVIVFDLLFSETSNFQNETGDDDTFAQLAGKLKAPVVWGAAVDKKGAWQRFAPPVKDPAFGAVNVGNDKIYRWYQLTVSGKPSLALKTTSVAGGEGGGNAHDNAGGVGVGGGNDSFLLHFYGPHLRSDGRQTFRYVPAYSVLSADLDGPEGEEKNGISPEMFRGKIVILGAISAGMVEQDLKSSPLSAEFPGPEIHATAIEDLLRGDRVHTVWPELNYAVALFCALLVSAGVVYPRRASLKIAAPILVVGLLLAAGILLFRGHEIYWLSPVTGLLATGIATPLAFGWTYFLEDRQRRFMLKALSKVVSPAIAEQLAREPERLALGTKRMQITVLFTDLANFTDLSEGMDVVALGKLVNRYLGEMSAQILKQDGTLDKYIGDAIMCFWNAPLTQADHAARACRAALGMAQRERELHEEFASLGTSRIFTRIGINTTVVAVGFIGSEQLFNYTALGDGVNLASRLEGANKIYHTQILLSESTAELVRGLFRLRMVDVLRVKGKKLPMAVYELLGERGAPDDAQAEELAGRYEEAFTAYQARRWEDSEKILLELSTSMREDGPTKTLLERVRAFRTVPAPEGWDGVYVAESK